MTVHLFNQIGHFCKGFFFQSRPTAVFAVECQNWLNVARLWWKSIRLKHTSFSPNDCVMSFIPPRLSLVCMCFLFVVLNASLVCILVILLNARQVHARETTREELSLLAQANIDSDKGSLLFLLWTRMVATELFVSIMILLFETKHRCQRL